MRFLRLICLACAAGLSAPVALSAESIPVPPTVAVPAGPFIAGSDADERAQAYALDETAYGSPVTRRQRWYADENPRKMQSTGAYAITATPVTNAHYAAFIAATGHPAPDIDITTWTGFGLIHPHERTRRHAWIDRTPPPGRDAHPVVLVSHADARAYAAWLSDRTGRRWRLPTETEWEKAARGTDGRLFPWGNDWNPALLASADAGPFDRGLFDTAPVGSFPDGASPFGLLDGAGLVYEWTATPASDGRYIVKGGSWDDRGCGVCRPAARHGRPADLRHILIGFRLLREPG